MTDEQFYEWMKDGDLCGWGVRSSILRRFASLRSALAEKEREVAEAKSSREHSVYWYGTRFDSIRDWAKSKGEPFWTEINSLIANGVPDIFSSHEHAQNYNRLKHRAEQAESALKEKEREVAELKRTQDNTIIDNGFGGMSRELMKNDLEQARADHARAVIKCKELQTSLDHARYSYARAESARDAALKEVAEYKLLAESRDDNDQRCQLLIQKRKEAESARDAAERLRETAFKCSALDSVRAESALKGQQDALEMVGKMREALRSLPKCAGCAWDFTCARCVAINAALSLHPDPGGAE